MREEHAVYFFCFSVSMQTVAHTISPPHMLLLFTQILQTSLESFISDKRGGVPLFEMLLMCRSPGGPGSLNVSVFIAAGERWCPGLLGTGHSHRQITKLLARLHRRLLARLPFCPSGGRGVTSPYCFSLSLPDYHAMARPALYPLTFWVSSCVNCFLSLPHFSIGFFGFPSLTSFISL